MRTVFAVCSNSLTKTVICLLLTALLVFAHHSLSAEFDRRMETEYRVTVVSFSWENPHGSFRAAVEHAGGASVWTFELPSPSGLVRYGWTPDTLHNGDLVTVRAFPAKNESARASVHSVTLSGGHTIEIDHPFARPPAK
jgi:hypothetical protein